MVEFFKKYSKDIRIGLVVAIIMLVLTKLGGYLLELVMLAIPKIGIPIFDFFVNLIYKSAASYSSSSMIWFFTAIFFSVFFLVAFYIAMRPFKKDVGEQLYESVVPCKESNSRKNKVVLLMSISFFDFLLGLFIFVIPGMYYSKFEKNLIAIRPYIEEQEYNLLKSKWVLMKGKNDYLIIDETITNIKKKNNLEK
ncbi:hypothetical protein B7990_11325 [Fibrobacter sp. UWB4]|uniref:hypothetical protein n=1 Tax=Fibrobacter sp. UWB4 TaxID=1964356 RepID=UPI000B522329|nr:hypothetical protein [Fibrobacter sp. UWB4]OWV16869.1 hypothetical protein B7990_11325 [Fibrobacter sp. UWB4]